MQTNPEQWADKVLDDVIIAWSEHGHSAGIEAIQAAFAEQNARLVGALEDARRIITEIDDYMKRPELGDWGTECACCMGELLDDDRDAICPH